MKRAEIALPVDLSDQCLSTAREVAKETPDTGRNEILRTELDSGRPELTKEEIYRLMGYSVDLPEVSDTACRELIKELYNELDQYEGGE